MTAGLVNLVIFRWIIYPSEAEFNSHGVDILLWSLAIVTPSWILVTLLTRPTHHERLKTFYRKVRVAGPGWATIAREVRTEDGEAPRPGYSIGRSLVAWLSATALVYAVLFATGKILLGEPEFALALLAVAIACFVILYLAMRTASPTEQRGAAAVTVAAK